MMSDHFIIIVPQPPTYVPDNQTQRSVIEFLHGLAPKADRIYARKFDGIQFIDCGSNLERIICSHCQSELDVAWWGAMMDQDFEGAFTLKQIALPCCQATLSLDQLDYQMPQAFGEFTITLENANIGALNAAVKTQLEQMLKTSIAIVYKHS